MFFSKDGRNLFFFLGVGVVEFVLSVNLKDIVVSIEDLSLSIVL